MPPPPRVRGKVPLVMIDAGHGGKDTGTISIQDGRYEKDVTLAIALATAHALEQSGKVRVKLTRSDDRFIPLGGRVAIARAAKADLFVSIHADSAPNPQARGASVYTLSEVASDAVAERLAARENTADIIAGVNLGVDAPGVGDIIIDLARRDTMNASVAFAETLQDSLETKIGFRGEFHHFGDGILCACKALQMVPSASAARNRLFVEWRRCAAAVVGRGAADDRRRCRASDRAVFRAWRALACATICTCASA